jgi:hypothetical protein
METGKFINWYIRLRAEKEATEKRHKEELAPIKEKMQTIEVALQKIMQEQGLKNLRSDQGTAYLANVANVKVTRKEDLINFVKEYDRWDVLDIRANKTAAQEEEIPGVEVTRGIKVNIRVS